MAICRIAKKDNFVIIDKTLLENSAIPLDVKGMLCWALCKPNDWEFNVTHMSKSLGVSTRTIYRLIAEAEKHGYVTRYQAKSETGTFGRFVYVFHDEPQGVAQREIKKISPLCQNPYAVFWRHTKNNSLSSSYEEDKDTKNEVASPKPEEKGTSPPPSKQPPSPSAQDLSHQLLESIKKTHPKLKEPQLDKWAKEIDAIMRVDKRDISEIKELIDWLPKGKFWKFQIQSASSFRDKFDKIRAEVYEGMENERIKENKKWAIKAKETYRKELAHLVFSPGYLINKFTGKDISFDLPIETFREAFKSMVYERNQ